MANFNRFDLLEAVELWAEDNGLISSEHELSERFDNEILPIVIEQYGEDDQDAIDQTFNDWTDSLCKDGELHDEQYSQYCYVGKYSG